MESLTPSFAERLALAIAHFGGNAAQLARKTGISRRSIGNYLAGDTQPSYTKVVLIAEVTGVNLEWLATGKGEMLSLARTAHDVDNAFRFEIVQAVEEAVHQYGLDLSTHRKAKIAQFVYNTCLHERAKVPATVRECVELLL
jgi:transcriptional regulator with XRE-family HTH domain